MNARTRLFWLYLLGGVVVGGVVWAAPFSGPPHTFQAGDQLSASALNANFEALTAQLDEMSAASTIPSGTIVAFGGPTSTIPDGWALCDGAELSRAEYHALFEAIGTSHGSGDDANTFNLPDLRGYFLRGADAGAGVDPDASTRLAARDGGNAGDLPGSVQNDAFESHKHGGDAWSAGSVRIESGNQTMSANRWRTNDPSSAEGFWGVSVAPPLAGGSETRPKNVAVNFIIKL